MAKLFAVSTTRVKLYSKAMSTYSLEMNYLASHQIFTRENCQKENCIILIQIFNADQQSTSTYSVRPHSASTGDLVKGLVNGNTRCIVVLDRLSPASNEPWCKVLILNITTNIEVPKSDLEFHPPLEVPSISDIPETSTDMFLRDVLTELLAVDLMRM